MNYIKCWSLMSDIDIIYSGDFPVGVKCSSNLMEGGGGG